MMVLLRKKIPLLQTNPYLGIFFGVSVIAFILGFLLFAFTYLLPSINIVKAEGLTWTPPSGKSILEVHIANNGMVYLQGANIESISGTTIVASTSWNNTKLKWTIYTNGSDYGKRHFGTSFYDSKGASITISDLHVGDIISVNGILDVNYMELVVKADVIRI